MIVYTKSVLFMFFVVKVYPLLCMIVPPKNKFRESQCYWTLPAAELRVDPGIRVGRAD